MTALVATQTASILILLSFYVVAVGVTNIVPHHHVLRPTVRRVQIAASSLYILISLLKALIRLSGSAWDCNPHPDIVYTLFLSLVWFILLLGLIESSSEARIPHYGAWTISLVSQALYFLYSLDSNSEKTSLLIADRVLQLVLLILVLALIIGGALVHNYQFSSHVNSHFDEHRPLLAPDRDSTRNDKEQSSIDEDEDTVDEEAFKELKSRALWQYVRSFRTFLPFMWPTTRKQFAYLGVMCICTLISRIVGICVPLALGVVINHLETDLSVPWPHLALYATLHLLQSPAGLPLFEGWFSHQVTSDMTIALNRYSYDHIMNLSADFHDSKKSSLIWQAMSQGQSVIDLFHDTAFTLLPTILDLSSTGFVLWWLFGGYMAFIISTVIVVFTWITVKALSLKTAMQRTWIDAFNDEYHQLTESTTQWSAVSQFGRIPYEMKRYREKGDLTRSTLLSWMFYDACTVGGRYMVLTLAFLAACSIGALQIAHGQRNVGDFVVLISYWRQLSVPLTSVAGEISRTANKLVDAEKLLILLEKKPTVSDVSNAQLFTYLGGAVEFENVSFSYDGIRKATNNVSFHARPGQTIALVGETGGGKSTILRLLFRFYDANEGRILIDGQDIREMAMESFRKHIAIVPQSPAVFNMSVLDNVRYPDLTATEDDVIEACRAVSLHEKVMSFAKGYHEEVGERGLRLSGGELQRLAIARAILKKADILLLDEATSNVDSVTEAHIQESLKKLCNGKTTFIIAHRLSTILLADQILVIQGGKLVESGNHATLIKRKGPYNELWTSQLKLQMQTQNDAEDRSESKQAQILTNDLNSSDDERTTLFYNTIKDSELDRPKISKGSAQDNDKRKGHGQSHDHASHQLSHSLNGRGRRSNARDVVQAMKRRLSRSKSPIRKGLTKGSSPSPSRESFETTSLDHPSSAAKDIVTHTASDRISDALDGVFIPEDVRIGLPKSTPPPVQQGELQHATVEGDGNDSELANIQTEIGYSALPTSQFSNREFGIQKSLLIKSRRNRTASDPIARIDEIGSPKISKVGSPVGSVLQGSTELQETAEPAAKKDNQDRNDHTGATRLAKTKSFSKIFSGSSKIKTDKKKNNNTAHQKSSSAVS